MKRREFLGSVQETALSSGISNTDSSMSVVDGSTFPTGSEAPFAVVVNRGQASEEKMLCSSRSSNTITISERGYDGTVASAHLSGSKVDHVLDAQTIQDMNTTTYDNSVLSWMGV